MILRNYAIDGDKITIDKKELEEWREHYFNVAKQDFGEIKVFNESYYFGKMDVLCDILKMFDELCV